MSLPNMSCLQLAEVRSKSKFAHNEHGRAQPTCKSRARANGARTPTRAAHKRALWGAQCVALCLIVRCLVLLVLALVLPLVLPLAALEVLALPEVVSLVVLLALTVLVALVVLMAMIPVIL